MSVYDLGDVVTLDFTIKLDNVLTDPTTLTLTITDPTGVVTTPIPTHSSAGTYTIDLPIAVAGTWSYTWQALGTVQAAESGTFRVLAAGELSVDLREVKQHLQMNLLTVTNDDELLRFVLAAEKAIGHRTGPLAPVSVTEKHDGGRTLIILHNPRAVSLTGVTYTDGRTTTLSDFDLDTDTGILYWGYGTAGAFTSGCRNVIVQYRAGFSPLPEDLRQAVKELVRHLWKTQRGADTGARPGFTDTQDAEPVAGSFSSWPPRVQELVAPYSTPMVA